LKVFAFKEGKPRVLLLRSNEGILGISQPIFLTKIKEYGCPNFSSCR
jgi:hypothetical protein